jgi:hypothetical protein
MKWLHFVVAASISTPALAQDYAYNTFSANFGYETLAGSTVSGEASSPGYTDTANRFVSLRSGNITEFIVPVSHNNAGPNSFDINLRADNASSPGDIIHTWTIVDQALPFDGVYHEPIRVPVAETVTLQEGVAYWLDMHATARDTWMVWHFTRPPIFETVAQRFSDNGVWNVLQPGFTSAYAVVVPAPAAAGIVPLAIWIACRRRR